MVGGLRTDLAIVSTTTLDGEGLYHQKESSVALMRAVLRAAHRRVLLADRSKIGQTSLFRVGRWELVDDLLVTGSPPGGGAAPDPRHRRPGAGGVLTRAAFRSSAAVGTRG